MVYDYLMEVGDRQGKFMDAGKTRYLVDNLNSTIEWLSSIEATVKGSEEEILAMPYQELSRPRRKDGALKTSYHVLDVEAIHKSLQPWRVHNSTRYLRVDERPGRRDSPRSRSTMRTTSAAR